MLAAAQDDEEFFDTHSHSGEAPVVFQAPVGVGEPLASVQVPIVHQVLGHFLRQTKDEDLQQQFGSLVEGGDIVATHLETAQGYRTKTVNRCGLIVALGVYYFNAAPLAGHLDNATVTHIVAMVGNELLQQQFDSDIRSEDENAIDSSGNVEFGHAMQWWCTQQNQQNQSPFDEEEVEVVRGEDITNIANLDHLAAKMLHKDCAACLYFKDHYVLMTMCGGTVDLIEPLPNLSGSDVGIRIRCFTLDALKVALQQYALLRLSDDQLAIPFSRYFEATIYYFKNG